MEESGSLSNSIRRASIWRPAHNSEAQSIRQTNRQGEPIRHESISTSSAEHKFADYQCCVVIDLNDDDDQLVRGECSCPFGEQHQLSSGAL